MRPPESPNVVITDHSFENLALEEAVLAPLGCRIITRVWKTEEELIELVGEADCVITQFAPLKAPVIEGMRHARAIIRYGIGVDNVNLEVAGRRGIPVCNVPDYCTDEVADHTLALMLSLTRRIAQISSQIRSGIPWTGIDVSGMVSLKNCVVGIVGFGRIGREVAARLRGFKCRILTHDPVVTSTEVEAVGARLVSLEEILGLSDVITLHCPATPETRHLICRDTLNRMKRGVMLINVARGSVVKEADLVAALRDGHVAAAGLDVTDPEPIGDSSPLLSMENVLITHHVAAWSPNAVRHLRTRVAEIAVIALQNGQLPNVVNAQTLRGGHLD